MDNSYDLYLMLARVEKNKIKTQAVYSVHEWLTQGSLTLKFCCINYTAFG